MTGGSAATSSTHGRSATESRPATTSGTSMSAGKHGGETPATLRTKTTSTAGSTGQTTMKGSTGSAATSGGTQPALKSNLRRPATTSGNGILAGSNGGETPATLRTKPTSTAGSSCQTTNNWSTGSPATSGGAPPASEHWISQGLRQQIMKWLRSHAISPVHAGETASLLTSSKCK